MEHTVYIDFILSHQLTQPPQPLSRIDCVHLDSCCAREFLAN